METFKSLTSRLPGLLSFLKNLGHYDIDNDSLPARLFSAETYLKANNIDTSVLPEEFKHNVNNCNGGKMPNRPVMVAFLPCGLRNAFKETFYDKFPDYRDNEKIVIEGNLNYEKNIYHYLDHVLCLKEFPDIFLSSDINNLFYKTTLNRISSSNLFETYHLNYHNYFNVSDIEEPTQKLNIFTANFLVMVVNNNKFQNKAKPEAWYALLSPVHEKSIVLRGDGDFFCNAVLYPFYAEYGNEAIRILGQNTIRGMHPAEMVKEINSNKENSASIYVMPYSFACKVRNFNYSIVWPEDGAILSPVQFLIKKDLSEKYKPIVEFLLSKQLAESMEQQGFPAFTADVIKKYPGRNIKWLGWKFINNYDISILRKQIQDLFFENFNRKGD
jgi:ABC-type Fe3+ transport system substrate-binding protein